MKDITRKLWRWNDLKEAVFPHSHPGITRAYCRGTLTMSLQPGHPINIPKQPILNYIVMVIRNIGDNHH